jgi:putative transposase
MGYCAHGWMPGWLASTGHTWGNAAIATTYATGAYSYATIAAHFGIHLSTVGRIVGAAMQQREN